MKFRRSVMLLIAGLLLVCFFTKPTKDAFIKYIQPSVSRTHIPPVVEYNDKFLYATVTATYIDAANPVHENKRVMAPARKETYIGLFGRYWKTGQ